MGDHPISLKVDHDDVDLEGAPHVGLALRTGPLAQEREGFGARVRSLPVAPAIAILRALERVHLSPLYPWIYETVVHDSFVAIEHARERLGWTPRHSNRDALLRNFAWYRAHAAELGGAGVTHRVPWKQGALSLAKLAFPSRSH